MIELVNTLYDDPRKCFGSSLVELAAQNKDVVFLSCDSSLGAGAGPFNTAYPDRHFEFGIAEQNAMSHAAGLATTGKIPFIAAYVPFVSYRCFEQIRNDVCKTNLNVNIMGNNSGFSVSALGPTHTILEDVGVLRSLPNITIISPADGIEYSQAPYAASQIDGPLFIRISRMKSRRIYSDDHKLIVGKADIPRKGTDITIIASGTTVSIALETAEILSEQKIDAEIINLSTIKPIDKEVILESVSKTRCAVTVEEHSVINGIGSAVSDILIREDPVKMDFIGVADEYAPVGSYNELMSHYGLGPADIAIRIQTFLDSF